MLRMPVFIIVTSNVAVVPCLIVELPWLRAKAAFTMIIEVLHTVPTVPWALHYVLRLVLQQKMMDNLEVNTCRVLPEDFCADLLSKVSSEQFSVI